MAPLIWVFTELSVPGIHEVGLSGAGATKPDDVGAITDQLFFIQNTVIGRPMFMVIAIAIPAVTVSGKGLPV